MKENSSWLIGNGTRVKFWEDGWCGEPLLDSFNLTLNDVSTFPILVKDYIRNSHWIIPDNIITQYPDLRLLGNQVTIPIEDCEDRLTWKHYSNGELSLKDAYNFKRHEAAKVQWAPLLWCKGIPPSKSLLAWRLIHDKVPTDEKLAERALHFPSMCSLCYNHTESTFHLFFECTFAYKLWCWLALVVNITLQFHSITNIWSLCNRGWSPQCKIVVQASIANIISTIWYSRNQSRFRDVKPNWRLAINSIIYAVTLLGNNTLKHSNSSVNNLIMLKKFDIIVRPPKPPDII